MKIRRKTKNSNREKRKKKKKRIKKIISKIAIGIRLINSMLKPSFMRKPLEFGYKRKKGKP
jgi:hypothetical protein